MVFVKSPTLHVEWVELAKVYDIALVVIIMSLHNWHLHSSHKHAAKTEKGTALFSAIASNLK